MPDQPYQFGDVVDGHRWTITGWEPVEPVERTVGVPRLLEARYAATQEAQARRQTQILEPEASLVVEDSLPEPDADVEPSASLVAEVQVVEDEVVEEAALPEPALEPEPSYSLEELLGGGRRVVAAPDLAIEYDAEPAQDVEPQQVDDAPEPWSTEASPVDEVAVDEPVDEAVLEEPIDDVLLEERVDESVVEEPAEDVIVDAIVEEPAGEPVEAEVVHDDAIVEEPAVEPVEAEVVLDEPVAEEYADDLDVEELAVEAPAAAEPVGVAALVVDEPVVEELVAEAPPAEELPAMDSPVAVPDEFESSGDAVVYPTEDALRADPVGPPAPEPERYDARPAGMRAWYGLGLDTVEEPEPEPAPTLAAEDDSDAPFAAALALGARRFAERYQPSEIETIARTAASADHQPVDSWGALVAEPIDEWTSAPSVVPPAEQLDARALTYTASTLPTQAPAAEGRATTTFEAAGPEPVAEPEPTPRVVVHTPAPPAGWYPGSV